TIGSRLLAGRAIDASDRDGGERVVVLSAPLARQLYPSGDAIGQHVALAGPDGKQQTYTVVGVTADLVSTDMASPRPQLFLSLAQHPVSDLLVIARGAPSDPSMRGAFANAIAGGLRVLSKPGETDAVFRELMTGEGLVDDNRSDILTMSAVGGVAAAVALTLATFGVYGVIAFM